jgi:dolichol kinase
LLLGASAAAVAWQTQKHSQSLTIVRKVFHFLIVLVYVPGLIYQCTLLYIASVIILALLILLEVSAKGIVNRKSKRKKKSFSDNAVD